MSETPRIAIPMPHSRDAEYAQRAIPQYEHAVRLAGGEPVRILLDQHTDELKKVIAACDGVLLPGSNADVDPARFSQERSLRTAAPDARRDEVDDLLLDDAYAHRKPVLGICYGLQSLNVHQRGSLVQHIPDFLPEATRTRVDHEAGKTRGGCPHRCHRPGLAIGRNRIWMTAAGCQDDRSAAASAQMKGTPQTMAAPW